MGLGEVAQRRGDLREAHRLLEAGLALKKEISNKNGMAYALLMLADIEESQGEEQAAIRRSEESLALARELKSPDLILRATAYRALLPGGDSEDALAAFEEYEDRVELSTKMECRFQLWELTKDQIHLTEAKRLLDFAVKHSPEDCRTSMIENVPLHRDIMKAWEESGKKGT
jgi:tetratricopeptide (TPR) repeat protein